MLLMASVVMLVKASVTLQDAVAAVLPSLVPSVDGPEALMAEKREAPKKRQILCKLV